MFGLWVLSVFFLINQFRYSKLYFIILLQAIDFFFFSVASVASNKLKIKRQFINYFDKTTFSTCFISVINFLCAQICMLAYQCIYTLFSHRHKSQVMLLHEAERYHLFTLSQLCLSSNIFPAEQRWALWTERYFHPISIHISPQCPFSPSPYPLAVLHCLVLLFIPSNLTLYQNAFKTIGWCFPKVLWLCTWRHFSVAWFPRD